jgi:hypothetical protein
MVALILSLAIAAPDARPAVMELARLEGRWFSEGKVELVISGDTIKVDAGDGFNWFTGRLVLHPHTARFVIVGEGEPATECRYRVSGDVLHLITRGVVVEYRRRAWAP